MMISQPTPPPIPVTTLADRIKTWPMLAAHRFEHIEAVLISFEERLAALEPKTALGGKSIFASEEANPAALVPLSKPVPIPVPLPPIPEPSILPAPSYAQSETFTGKSIFAPPAQPSGTGGSPPPTIFAPAKI
jgi:hypothetical protein